jgi:acyl-CoA thioesterase I
MNSVALYFASGESLYPSAALLLLAVAVSPFLKRGWQLRSRNILCWFALCLMIIASPPVSPFVGALVLSLFLAWIVSFNRAAPTQSSKFLRIVVAVLLAATTLAIATVEYSHRKIPVVTGASSDHLVVIGDSISAGIDPSIPSWPKVFQQTTGIPVKNLALAGAQVNEGPYMAGKVTPDDRVVLVELGGNDLLANLASNRFERDLDSTLAELALPGRTVVMFELPLLPHKTAYGEIQRRLANKYGVYLIPKRKFIEVIKGADATSDGIHLAPEGTRRMSALISQVLGPILQPGRTT